MLSPSLGERIVTAINPFERGRYAYMHGSAGSAGPVQATASGPTGVTRKMVSVHHPTEVRGVGEGAEGPPRPALCRICYKRNQ